MDQTAAGTNARDGYDQMSEVYADHVELEMTVPSVTRFTLEAFAHEVRKQGSGRVADVGCGPGHVTAFLAGLGLDIFGVDISPALLDIARATHPEIRFETGQLDSLRVDAGSLQAIVSKHSLIHTPAHLVPAVLEEFARVLTPRGLLFLSFFGSKEPSSHGEGFDHAVTTAYQLDVETVAELLRAAGLTEQLRIVRQPRENERQLPHATFFARR